MLCGPHRAAVWYIIMYCEWELRDKPVQCALTQVVAALKDLLEQLIGNCVPLIGNQ